MDIGNLLRWAVISLIGAPVAGLLGFGGLASYATDGARLLFLIAIVLFVLSLVFRLMRRGV